MEDFNKELSEHMLIIGRYTKLASESQSVKKVPKRNNVSFTEKLGVF